MEQQYKCATDPVTKTGPLITSNGEHIRCRMSALQIDGRNNFNLCDRLRIGHNFPLFRSIEGALFLLISHKSIYLTLSSRKAL